MKPPILVVSLLVLSATAIVYYLFFTLDQVPISQKELLGRYQYDRTKDIDFQMESTGEHSYRIRFTSFDGQQVTGQLSYPQAANGPLPVLIGLHAMGRSYPRWWVDAIKDRPTVTRVNEITKLALAQGHAVIAIDARFHGARKDPNRGLASIMNDLHFFADKTDYEKMIHHTVLDHRVLLDWLSRQPQFDSRQINIAGYSMGAQIGLLLAGIDERINNTLAIVPPHVDDKTALVAPKNIANRITGKRVWLLTADDDEYATTEENSALFEAITATDKQHLVFAGNHILPEDYVASLAPWFHPNTQAQQ